MARAVRVLLPAGLLLGVLSRLDETTPTAVPLSDNATWVGAAVLAGLLLPAAGARAGVLVLTAANGAYYAWIAATEPGTPLGAPLHWLLLGVLTGVVFGTAGAVARRAAPPARALALAAPLLAVALDRAGLLAALLP